MVTTLQFICHPLLSKPTAKFKSPSTNPIYLKNPSSPFFSNCSLISHKTQIQNPLIYAGRSKKTRIGSEKSVRFMLQSAYLIASKLNIVPEPLSLLIRQFGGANWGGNGGGGLGFVKDFGWGDFDGWRRNKRFGVLGFLIVFCLSLLLFWGKEMNVDVLVGCLVVLVGFSSIRWKRNFVDWIVGFCSCALLVILGQRREDLKILVKRVRGAGSIVRGRRLRRGRAM